MKLRTLALPALSLLTLVAAGTKEAEAAPLSLNLGAPIYQQSEPLPCVIGDPSCKNTVDFDYTVIPPNTDSAIIDSPEYTVQQLRDYAGDLFTIGIDVNQAQEVYTLNGFTLFIDDVPEFTYTGPSQIPVLNNGTGFSDANLVGFDLTGFAGTAIARFTSDFSNADDGREQYFLVSGGTTPIPEPASMMLLGSGLLAPFIRRRKHAQSA